MDDSAPEILRLEPFGKRTPTTRVPRGMGSRPRRQTSALRSTFCDSYERTLDEDGPSDTPHRRNFADHPPISSRQAKNRTSVLRRKDDQYSADRGYAALAIRSSKMRKQRAARPVNSAVKLPGVQPRPTKNVPIARVPSHLPRRTVISYNQLF